jgi:hypothetical protein
VHGDTAPARSEIPVSGEEPRKILISWIVMPSFILWRQGHVTVARLRCG